MIEETKLKTLNDIECNCGQHSCCEITMTVKSREAAIEWIKHGDLHVKNSMVCGKENYAIRTMAVNTWIKHFFNITDEEVKR